MPAAAALKGVEAAEGRIDVSLLRPSPGVGSELLALERAAEAGEPEVTGRSPLAVERRAPARLAAPHLSNAALERYDECGYRFYVERVLRLRGETEAAGGDGALDFGNAIHALLEWSARNRWVEPPAERIRAAVARTGLEADAERIERATAFVRGWLASPLCAELRGARTRLAPEAPFLLDVRGAVVRGQLDLIVTAPGEAPLVVDYKTNRLGDRTPEEVMAQSYETQRDLYALAAASAAEAETARTAFVFLERPDEPVVREHDAAAIAATRERLEALVAGIAAERFEVTPNPHRELCHDCPARRRLCVYSYEQTMGEPEPEPARAVSRLAVFGYASLVSRESAAQTLGREVGPCPLVRLTGWRRRWSLVRDNEKAEKTFARADDGWLPPYMLGLNIEPADADEPGPNGVLIALTDAELDRLDIREVRYDRVDVTDAIEPSPRGDGLRSRRRLHGEAGELRHRPARRRGDPPPIRRNDRGRLRRARGRGSPPLPGHNRPAPGRADRRGAGAGRDPAGEPEGLVSLTSRRAP